MRAPVLAVGLNVFAAALYAFVAVRLGFFGHVGASLFWSPDSHSYKEVADWLFGGPNSIETMHRPFFYPLLFGSFQRLGGDWGIWALNLLCWLSTLNLAAAAAWRITGRLAAGAVVFLLVATNISIIVLTFQALTEPLVLLLESLWIAGLAWTTLPPSRPRDFAALLLPITLLAVVKPSYQLEVVIGLVLLAITLVRTSGRRLRTAATVVACCLPLAVQLTLNLTANHFFGLSSTGELEFRDYYVAQVYAEVKGLPLDLTQARADVASLTTSEMVKYLVDHREKSVAVLFENLHGNLTSPSPFIDSSNNPTLASAVQQTNRAYLRVHLVFLPIVALALWRRRNVRLLLLYVFAAILILYPSLIYDQGDRYINMAMPFWSVAYVVAVVQLLPDVAMLLNRRSRATALGT
jgi:hypothetical protein